MTTQNNYAYGFCIFLCFNIQNLVAQTISVEKYADGQIKKRFHIQQKDTFCVENLFENGNLHSIIWHDSAHYFHSNQIIAQKRYGKTPQFPFWYRIANNNRSSDALNYFWEGYDSMRAYYPDGKLQKHIFHQGDSLWESTNYLPNGAIYESIQYQKINNHIFNYFKINQKGVQQIQTDTIAHIQKQSGYSNHQLVQQEIYDWNESYQISRKQQILMDSTGHVVQTWTFKGAEPTIDKDNGFCLYGLRDTQGAWLVSPKYESIKEFNYSYYIVNENSKYGIINKYGKEIVPPTWDFLGPLQSEQHNSWNYNVPYLEDIPSFSPVFLVEPLYPALSVRLLCRKNNAYGVIDNYGKIILKPVYQYIRKCKNDLYEIQINGQWGIVDAQGKMIVSPKYKGVDFTDYNYLFCVRDTIKGATHYTDGYAAGLVNDKDETILPCLFSTVEVNSTYYPRIWVRSFWRFNWKSKKMGIFDLKKGWLVDTTHSYKSEYASFEPYFIVDKQDSAGQKRYGLWDTFADTMLLSLDYQSIVRTEQRGYFYNSICNTPNDVYETLLLWKVTQQNKCGIYDSKQRKWLLPLLYDDILFFKDSIYLASYHGKWQFMNAQGKALLSETFDAVGDFTFIIPYSKANYHQAKGYFAVKNNRMSFYTPYSFPTTTALKTLDRGDWFNVDIRKFSFGSDNNSWVIAPNGRVIISPKDSIVLLNEAYRIIRDKSSYKQQIIDNQGNRKSFLSKYNIKAMSLKGNWVVVQDTMTQRLGMITLDEKTILPCQFFGITEVDERSIIWARKDFTLKSVSDILLDDALCVADSNWQMYDKRGHLLTSVAFDYPFKWSNHLGIGQVHGKQGLWNAQGVTILPPKYDRIWYDTVQHLFYLVQLENDKTHRVGFANADGQLIIDANLMNMSLFGGNYAFVETEKGYGLIHKNGQYWIKPQPFAFQKSGFSIVDSVMSSGYLKNSMPYDFLLPTEQVFIDIKDRFVTHSERLSIENLLLEKVVRNYFIKGNNIRYQRNKNWHFSVYDELQLEMRDGYFRQRNLRYQVYGLSIKNIFYDGNVIRCLAERKIENGTHSVYGCKNFELKNNIWQEVPLDAILVWNEANIAALNQLMFKKISELKNDPMDCSNPNQLMERVRNLFYKLPEGLQFLMPRSDDSSQNFVPILLTWAELKPFLIF